MGVGVGNESLNNKTLKGLPATEAAGIFIASTKDGSTLRKAEKKGKKGKRKKTTGDSMKAKVLNQKGLMEVHINNDTLLWTSTWNFTSIIGLDRQGTLLSCIPVE